MKTAVANKQGLVEVRPIKKEDSWHGYSGTKDDFSQPKTFSVLYDARKGMYATGLSKEDEEKYSKNLGLELHARFNPNEEHKYWDSKAARFKLPNRPVYFDPKIPLEYIRIQNMKASSMVANSQRELELGEWDEATHVIFDETEDIAIKAKKTQIKKQCYKVAEELSSEELANVLTAISVDNSIYRGRSQNFLDVELEKVINDRPKRFLKYAKMDAKGVYTRASILEALQRNILTKEGLSIYYMSELIAHDFEAAIAYFMNPQNQKIKVAILEKLND